MGSDENRVGVNGEWVKRGGGQNEGGKGEGTVVSFVFLIITCLYSFVIYIFSCMQNCLYH